MATTSFDLGEVGIIFRDAGLAINKRVENHLHELNSNDIQILLNKAQELLLISKTMFAKAVVQIGEEAKGAFKSLEEAKDEIDTVMRRIRNVQTIIDVSARLVMTASAILSGNVGKIITNANDVVSGVKELLDDDV